MNSQFLWVHMKNVLISGKRAQPWVMCDQTEWQTVWHDWKYYPLANNVCGRLNTSTPGPGSYWVQHMHLHVKHESFSIKDLQGLFVPFVRVGSGDPVRVLRLFHDEYTGWNWSIYCWDFVQLVTTESGVLLYLSPTSMQLYCWASSAGLLGNDPELILSVLYCTVP